MARDADFFSALDVCVLAKSIGTGNRIAKITGVAAPPDGVKKGKSKEQWIDPNEAHNIVLGHNGPNTMMLIWSAHTHI